VADLELLAKETHKFESRYLDTLVGRYPEERDKYEERSPMTHVDSINAPVIFYQVQMLPHPNPATSSEYDRT
jgi:dipeptidyl aminopeptidase/acylaminoacyl peptidase